MRKCIFIAIFLAIVLSCSCDCREKDDDTDDDPDNDTDDVVERECTYDTGWKCNGMGCDRYLHYREEKNCSMDSCTDIEEDAKKILEDSGIDPNELGFTCNCNSPEGEWWACSESYGCFTDEEVCLIYPEDICDRIAVECNEFVTPGYGFYQCVEWHQEKDNCLEMGDYIRCSNDCLDEETCEEFSDCNRVCFSEHC